MIMSPAIVSACFLVKLPFFFLPSDVFLPDEAFEVSGFLAAGFFAEDLSVVFPAGLPAVFPAGFPAGLPFVYPAGLPAVCCVGRFPSGTGFRAVFDVPAGRLCG